MLARVLFYWLPIAAYAGLIFFLSSLPAPLSEFTGFRGADAVAHALEYGVLGLLVARALVAGGAGLTPRFAVFAAWAVSTLYGATDEMHQSFVPTRMAELSDLAADSFGGLVGATAFAAVVRRRRAASPRASPESP